MMKKKCLTTEELSELCVALAGGIFDAVAGAEIRRQSLIDEVQYGIDNNDTLDDEERLKLLNAVAKIKNYNDEETDELLRLVRAEHRLNFYRLSNEKDQEMLCFCRDCLRKARFN